MSDSDTTIEVTYELANFTPDRILSNNSNRKTVCVLGKFSDRPEDQAIVILEKQAFTEQQILDKSADEAIFNAGSSLSLEFINDIYGNFLCFANQKANSIKTTIICPATEKHITKFSITELFVVRETPEAYKSITEPHLAKEQFTLDWVYNILEHKKEQERIVFEDQDEKNGFVLLPDLKWDGKTRETLYLIAICRRRDIKSLRDLTGAHLPLLENILRSGTESIEERYGVKKNQLRIYVHYQPTFYHFHVHFTALKHDASGLFCDRAHLLDRVIDNIKLLPDYYQRATLSFVLRESDRLYEAFTRGEAKETDGEIEPAAKRPRLEA